MLEAVLFDLDGTLIHEGAWYRAKWRTAAERAERELGVSGLEVALQDSIGKRGFFAPSLLDEALCELYGHARPDLVAQIMQMYRGAVVEPLLYDDALETLAELSGRFKLGLVTNGRTTTQQCKIETAGLARYFSSIVVCEAWPKPAVDGYTRCLAELEAAGAASVYVGDNPTTDFIGARSLSMTTVRLRRDLFSNLDADGVMAADYEVANLLEVNVLLTNLP